jgi:hypothetical protein
MRSSSRVTRPPHRSPSAANSLLKVSAAGRISVTCAGGTRCGAGKKCQPRPKAKARRHRPPVQERWRGALRAQQLSYLVIVCCYNLWIICCFCFNIIIFVIIFCNYFYFVFSMFCMIIFNVHNFCYRSMSLFFMLFTLPSPKKWNWSRGQRAFEKRPFSFCWSILHTVHGSFSH